MSIFSALKVYAGKWAVKASRPFTDDEISSVKSAYVADSLYGNSVCFLMNGGGQTFIPLSSDSELTVGQSVDLSKAELLTLSKEGEEDIYRVKA